MYMFVCLSRLFKYFITTILTLKELSFTSLIMNQLVEAEVRISHENVKFTEYCFLSRLWYITKQYMKEYSLKLLYFLSAFSFFFFFFSFGCCGLKKEAYYLCNHKYSGHVYLFQVSASPGNFHSIWFISACLSLF